MSEEDKIKLLKTAAILLTDAMIFQEVLARSGLAPTLASVRTKGNIKRGLEEAWLKILKKNYQPIFKIALNIIIGLPAHPKVEEALKGLMEIAEDIASSHILLKHDLFGRIYHKLLLGKLIKYHATYYTSLPAARLLARLLIGLSNVNSQNPIPLFNGEQIRVVDFACGSGTLLSAIYKELLLKHMLESPDPNDGLFHKYMIEEGLWGFDVLNHATHLAMTTLTLHNLIPVNRSRIFTLKLGTEEGEKYLGSLNFLESSCLTATQLLTGEILGPEEISEKEKKVVSIKLPKFHIVIMNPPFTRSVGGNLLFGALPKQIRSELQKELSKIRKKKSLSGIGQAGLGADFFFLAHEYLVENGLVGLVTPKGVLNGVSWRKVRGSCIITYPYSKSK